MSRPHARRLVAIVVLLSPATVTPSTWTAGAAAAATIAVAGLLDLAIHATIRQEHAGRVVCDQVHQRLLHAAKHAVAGIDGAAAVCSDPPILAPCEDAHFRSEEWVVLDGAQRTLDVVCRPERRSHTLGDALMVTWHAVRQRGDRESGRHRCRL